MKTIGLIGGIASGKSAVAAALAELGAVVLDADSAAREAIATPEACRLLVERWGPEALDHAGQPRRGAIAARVFAPTPEAAVERRWLESILHPRIRERFVAEIARLRDVGAPAVVVDAPLLVEAGWQTLCDELVWVECPESLRRQRAATRGWPPGEFERREAVQMPIDEKRLLATWTVDSSGALADLPQRVRQFWAERIERSGLPPGKFACSQ